MWTTLKTLVWSSLCLFWVFAFGYVWTLFG